MTRQAAERRSRAVARPVRRRGARRLSERWLWLGAIVLVAAIVGGFYLMNQRGGGSEGAVATLQTGDFHALAFSPDDPSVVFFGHHNGIMRSRDGGQTWRPLVEQRNFDAMGLAVTRDNPRQVYVAGHDIFQVSADGGATWQPVSHNLPGTDIHGFTLSPDDANRLYAVVMGQGVFASPDGGKTWQRLAGQVPGDVMALAAAGGTPETLYAGSMSAGVLRSTDGGQTWAPVVNGLDTRNVLALAVDPATRQTVYVGTGEGLYRTTDGGASWSKLPFPGSNVVTLAISPAQPNVLLAITVKDGQGLVYRSEDGGATWGK